MQDLPLRKWRGLSSQIRNQDFSQLDKRINSGSLTLRSLPWCIPSSIVDSSKSMQQRIPTIVQSPQDLGLISDRIVDFGIKILCN
jgi:hypothetical protein